MDSSQGEKENHGRLGGSCNNFFPATDFSTSIMRMQATCAFVYFPVTFSSREFYSLSGTRELYNIYIYTVRFTICSCCRRRRRKTLFAVLKKKKKKLEKFRRAWVGNREHRSYFKQFVLPRRLSPVYT